jgi:hypothetical protein
LGGKGLDAAFLISVFVEKITKNHHISGRCFKKPPLYENVSKNHHSSANK